MRKIIKIIFSLTLLLGLTTSVCFAGFAQRIMAEGGYDNVLVCDETNANIRSGPGVEYRKLEEVPYGSLLHTVSYSSNTWLKVISTNGSVGWVRSSLVVYPHYYAIPNRGDSSAPLNGYVNADNSNVRAGCSAGCAYVGTLYPGKPVTVLAKALGWYYIYTDNIIGWISQNYVTI